MTHKPRAIGYGRFSDEKQSTTSTADQGRNIAAYAREINDLLERHPWEISLTQLNLLDSHDTARFLTLAGGDRATVELATLLMFTFPGAPNLFYGDEIGLPGGHDPD